MHIRAGLWILLLIHVSHVQPHEAEETEDGQDRGTFWVVLEILETVCSVVVGLVGLVRMVIWIRSKLIGNKATSENGSEQVPLQEVVTDSPITTPPEHKGHQKSQNAPENGRAVRE